jgi:hypothetical protein
LSADHEGTFPIYGSLPDPQPKDKALPTDILVVIVHVDWIRAELLVKANVVMM